MNRTNFEHGGIALLMMVPFIFVGEPLAGAAFGTAFFMGREHAQAESRYIKANGGLRSRTPIEPSLGAFKPSSWNRDSVLDFVVPAVACYVLLLLV